MIDAEEIHFSLVDTVHDLDFPLTLELEDTWCWPLSCILGVTCDEEIEIGPLSSGSCHVCHETWRQFWDCSSKSVRSEMCQEWTWTLESSLHQGSTKIWLRLHKTSCGKPQSSLSGPWQCFITLWTGQSSCMVQTWQNTRWESLRAFRSRRSLIFTIMRRNHFIAASLMNLKFNSIGLLTSKTTYGKSSLASRLTFLCVCVLWLSPNKPLSFPSVVTGESVPGMAY